MLPVLNYFMQQTASEYVLCRCRAIESVGILVEALGVQDPNIGPHVPAMLEAVLSAFTTTDNADLRDYSHSMFGSVAKALGEGFAPWLQRVVPLAFASCEQEDGVFADDGESDDVDGAVAEDGEDSSDESEDGRGHFNVRTGECCWRRCLQLSTLADICRGGCQAGTSFRCLGMSSVQLMLTFAHGVRVEH
jgi:hypothetical protein